MKPVRRKRPDKPATWQASALDIGRLLAMLIVAVVLQATLAPQIRILGTSPDFALLTVVYVGLLRGPEMGAVFGFVAGACIAAAVFGPLGLSSLVLVLVGYIAGHYAETTDLSSGVAPIVAALVGTAVGEIMYAAAQFFLDRSVPLGFFLGHVFLPVLVLNGLLAAPGYLLTRLWLGEGVSGGPQTA